MDTKNHPTTFQDRHEKKRFPLTCCRLSRGDQTYRDLSNTYTTRDFEFYCARERAHRPDPFGRLARSGNRVCSGCASTDTSQKRRATSQGKFSGSNFGCGLVEKKSPAYSRALEIYRQSRLRIASSMASGLTPSGSKIVLTYTCCERSSVAAGSATLPASSPSSIRMAWVNPASATACA